MCFSTFSASPNFATAPASSSPEASIANGIVIFAASAGSTIAGCTSAATAKGVPVPETKETIYSRHPPETSAFFLLQAQSPRGFFFGSAYLSPPAHPQSRPLGYFAPGLIIDRFDAGSYVPNCCARVARTGEEFAHLGALFRGVRGDPGMISVFAKQEVGDEDLVFLVVVRGGENICALDRMLVCRAWNGLMRRLRSNVGAIKTHFCHRER